LDVGANIGIFSLAALVLGIRTIAIEPITDNLFDLSHAWRSNQQHYISTDNSSSNNDKLDTSLLIILKAAIVDEISEQSPNITIAKRQWRDKQDQASLFSNTIFASWKPVLEFETMSSLRLDNIIRPSILLGNNNNNNNSNSNYSTKIAMIKIDVQGAEPLVLRGMKNILEQWVSTLYLY
jgi:hypothetical protein